MSPQACGRRFSFEALRWDEGEFQIVGDMDWSSKVLYPCGTEASRVCLGGSEDAHGHNWRLGGCFGDVWRVELALGGDHPQVRSEFVRRAPRLVCHIEDQGRRLAVDRRAPPLGDWDHIAGRWLHHPLCMSAGVGEHERWVLLPQEGGRFRLQSCRGSFLAAWDASDQSHGLLEGDAGGSRLDWTISPVPEDPCKWFLSSCHGTQLARFDNLAHCLFMSQNRREWERWSLRLVPS